MLCITENGYGKRSPLSEYRQQSRAGKGIKALNMTERVGRLAGQLLVHEDEDILMITDDGTVIRTAVSDIPVHGRNTQGVKLMRVTEGSRIRCICRAEPEEEELAADGEEIPAEGEQIPDSEE